mgnify:CR=1 FL=1
MNTNHFDNYIYDSMESTLYSIASMWRGQMQVEIPNEEQILIRDRLVKQYNDVLELLISWGWNGSLSIDSELPDELMSEKYNTMVNEKHKLLLEDMKGYAEENKEAFQKIKKNRW